MFASARAQTFRFAEIVDPREWALFFDVDGTLVDFRMRPERVFAPRELVTALAALQREFGGAVAFVSGRTIADLDRIFFPLRLAASGVHGAELRMPGETAIRRLPREPALDGARTQLAAFANTHEGAFVEDKDLGLSLHTRACPDASEGAARLVESIAARSEGRLQAQLGSFVAELRRSDTDKGRAVRRLLEIPPFAGRRPMVFGDDIADADAFAACGEVGGVSVGVGTGAPRAQHRVANPHQCREAVFRLVQRCAAR